MKKDLMFPNKHKELEQEELLSEESAKMQEHREDQKIKEHIELLQKEKELEEDRAKRLKHKNRKMTEAQFRKSIKKKQAMAMRMRNIPIDIIAQKLDVSTSYAAGLIREAVSELPEETAQDLKKLLSRTVVRLIGNFEQVALAGGVREAEVMLKGITQLMRLCGLNIQRQQVEQTNMEVGSISKGIDVADLNLDLETKKKILLAIREKKLHEQDNKELQEGADEQELEDSNSESETV